MLAPFTPLPAELPIEEGEALEFEKITSQWLEPIEGGGTLSVVNMFGNVYARFGGYENQVEILATAQRLESELPELKVDRKKVEGGLEIVVGPAVETTDATEGSAARRNPKQFETRDRVDLVVFVPQGAIFEVRTGDGLIEAKGLKSDLIAESFKGDVRVRSIDGRVRAKTARGEISAMLETDVTKQTQELTTETGDIEVHLWEDADMEVRIATSGEISTDFSLTIEHRRFEEPGKYAEATVGGGGGGLRLYSKRGRIRLLRLQRPDRPYQQLNSDG
jgi:hypothetical protein